MQYAFRSEKAIALGLVVLGLLTHFAFFGTPNSAVFDEVHFGKFLSAYFTHEYYFDIHPPLGKLILAGWAWLWGFEPGFSFAQIGDVYPDRFYMILRFLPTLAGALLPVVIYGIARQLGIRPKAAALAGLLVALDNALLTQSRLILLDPFLLLFGFASIWCYLRWRSGGTKWLLPATGILVGAAFSIKWTGLAFFAFLLVSEAFHLWTDRRGSARKRWHIILLTLVVLPLAFYASAFAVHFKLLPKPGPGDGFMSRGFQQTSFVHKLVELNREMYQSNANLNATHPYGSDWYSWPLMGRPIYYWVKGDARIYLLGNPIVWWGSTIAILIAVMGLAAKKSKRLPPEGLILLAAWLLNLLPFIGVGRVMFMYHYLPALIWAILILVWLIDQLALKDQKRLLVGVGASAAALFLFFAPLSYGLSLSQRSYSLRTWLQSWR